MTRCYYLWKGMGPARHVTKARGSNAGHIDRASGSGFQRLVKHEWDGMVLRPVPVPAPQNSLERVAL